MRRIVAAFLLLASTAFAQTPNLGLEQPASGSASWGGPLNCNFRKLDLNDQAPIGIMPGDCSTSPTIGLTGNVPVAKGGTGNDWSAQLLGSLPYFGPTTGAMTVLPGNTTTTEKFLCQTGNGTVSAAPAWCTFDAGNLPSPLITALTQIDDELCPAGQWPKSRGVGLTPACGIGTSLGVDTDGSGTADWTDLEFIQCGDGVTCNTGGPPNYFTITSNVPFGSAGGTQDVTTDLGSDPTAGHCGQWKAGGLLTTSNVPCPLGGGGYSLTPGSISGNSCTDFTGNSVNVPYPAAGDPCVVGPPSAGPGTGITASCFFASATTVTIRLCNSTTSSQTGTTGTYKVRSTP